MRDWAMVTELPDLGIDVYIATESLDFTSRGGRLTADIQAVIAADYIRNLREESIKGLTGRLKQGLYPFRAPIGYLDQGKGKAKIPDPMKAPLIREMFELYASGQYSLRSLQVESNRRGLRNNNDKPLSLHGIATILNNPFYTGLIVIRRTGQSYEGVHKPIVSTSLYQQVQALKNGRCGKKITRHKHRYRGLFRCGLCGAAMSPELQKGHVYYRCQTPPCETKTIREDRLDAEIFSALTRLQLTPEQATALRNAWAKDQCEQEQATQREALSLQIAREETRLQRLADLLIDGDIDRGTFQEKKQALELSIRVRREERAALPDPRQIVQDRMDFLELMKNLTLLHICATPAEKREIVENAFSNRIVVGKNVDLKPHNWLQTRDIFQPVFSGAPYRHTSRTHPEFSRLTKFLPTLKEKVSQT